MDQLQAVGRALELPACGCICDPGLPDDDECPLHGIPAAEAEAREGRQALAAYELTGKGEGDD